MRDQRTRPQHDHEGDFFSFFGGRDGGRRGGWGRGGHHGGHGHGRGGNRFGPFGGGMRIGKMLSSGDLELIILALLAEKPRHGYEVMKVLGEQSSGMYTPSPGMVYPSLTYLEEMAYAVSSTDGAKKLFTITEAGKEYLATEQERADRALANLQAHGRRFAEFQQQFAEEEDTANEFGRDRDADSRERWQIKAEFRDLRAQLKEAIAEKMHAGLEQKKGILAILKDAIEQIRKL